MLKSIKSECTHSTVCRERGEPNRPRQARSRPTGAPPRKASQRRSPPTVRVARAAAQGPARESRATARHIRIDRSCGVMDRLFVDSALASVGPGFRGQGAQSPDSPPRPSRGASTHSAGQRHRAAAGCRLAGHVTRGRDEDPKFAPKARQPSLRHARRMCRRKATGAAVVQRTLTELAAIVSAL